MILRYNAITWALVGASILGLISLGCSREDASSNGKRTASRPGPEESFDGIVRFVKDHIETGAGGMPSGFVMESAGRRSQFIVHNEVTSEVIPPSKPDEPYRGTITVTSSSIYSLRRSEETDRSDKVANSKADQKNTAQGNMFDNAGSDDADMEVIDSNLVSSSPQARDTRPGPSETTVARQEDKNVSTFEFVYENDRWVLKTEPDENTERAIKGAFDRALSLQP
jgi:hypothetical protein